MDQESRKSTSKRSSFLKWFESKCKGTDPYQLKQFSDEDEENEDRQDDVFIKAMEIEQHNSTKELRIFVGTWNVAGRSPVGSLAEDLDEWLNRKDNAADIYVLGFQEVVPLKTRNVLGAEDPTEATKWNLLIEETLNNKEESPWLTPVPTRHSISNDNRNHIQHSYLLERRKSLSIRGPTPMRERKAQNEETKGLSIYKLMASKKMVGVFVSVWMKEELLKKYCISTVKVSSVACGIMGYLGNKGSVSVSMSIEGTSFCFIAAHLASGEKKGDEGRRNHQVSEIFRRTTFPRVPQDDDDSNPHPLTILGHDRIFWCGDLNYRLYLEDGFARKLIKKEDWTALQVFDQLQKEQEHGGVFHGWKEGSIEFAPTYKYSATNCNRYSGGPLSKSGEKQRTPAWCDRILWYGKGVRQLSYFRSEIKFSDHRPVSALFATEIKVNSETKSKVHPVNNVHLPTVAPSQTEQKDDKKSKSTLLSLIAEDKQ